jgi:type II secretory pathway component PulK
VGLIYVFAASVMAQGTLDSAEMQRRIAQAEQLKAQGDWDAAITSPKPAVIDTNAQ